MQIKRAVASEWPNHELFQSDMMPKGRGIPLHGDAASPEGQARCAHRVSANAMP
ncbi:MAG TPA: hypothetical protein VFT34_02535 [Verrucomicrobiae bacterium]|nr:hypothetical protein [Verrucomicrobiae bacterium]